MDSESEIKNNNSLVFELGDIIQIESPNNSKYHEITAFIEYIDNI